MTLLSGAADGTLRIDSDGLVGYLSLTVSAGMPSTAGFGLLGRFQVEINTTAGTETITRYAMDSNGHVIVDPETDEIRRETYEIAG
jgi:hypothetical protein